jgi:hypothetical protein
MYWRYLGSFADDKAIFWECMGILYAGQMDFDDRKNVRRWMTEPER